METFMPRVSPADATPDPSKHVNYTLGMVLGVDDFKQEFAYLSGRDQWLARDLIGYGTVSGLNVRIEKNDKGPRVLIECGAALSPRGQLIRVTPAQCAYLNPWLAANKETLAAQGGHLGSPPDDVLRLYVVLCYRDCATEMTPIPGEPCRSEDELMAASRLGDDFRLELRFKAPDQEEEDALRDFVEWLSQIEITDAGGATPEEFLKAIRGAAHVGSPPEGLVFAYSSVDFLFGSPPAGLSIPADRACEYLRAAFRVWVTELRPLWRPNWFSEWQCCDQKDSQKEQPKEECLLLAELQVPLDRVALSSDEIKVDDLRDIVINEDRRPFLIHSRLLQEWLLCGRAGAGRETQTATGVVTFRTERTGGAPARFVAESDLIDPGLGKGPISVQVAFVNSPDELVFGDVPRLQQVVGARINMSGATTKFRIIANTFETAFASEFSVRWFAYRPAVEGRRTEVTLSPLPVEDVL